MLNIRNLQAIVFDAYGTLFNPSGMQQRLETHFGPKAEEIGPLWRRKQLEYTWLRGMMGSYLPFSRITRDALQFACEVHDVDLDPPVADDLMEHYEYLPLYPEVPEALAALSERFRLAILTNADPYLLDQATAYNQIEPFFEQRLSVDQVKRFKPHPSVYELPGRHLGLHGRSLLFVSGNGWDAAGAKSAGLNVAWVRRQAEPFDRLGRFPDRQLSDLSDLQLLLRLDVVG